MSLARRSRRVSEGQAPDRLDHLQHARELQRVARDVGLARPGRDQQHRHARAEPEQVDVRRRDVVVEAAEVVPRDHDRRAPPLRAAHDRVHDLDGPVLARAHRGGGGMFGDLDVGDQPRDRRQGAVREVGEEVVVAHDLVHHRTEHDVLHERQRVDVVVVPEVVAPGHPGVLEQVGQDPDVGARLAQVPVAGGPSARRRTPAPPVRRRPNVRSRSACGRTTSVRSGRGSTRAGSRSSRTGPAASNVRGR
jgi:hypothetical protein